jgi:2-(1,2-epoxy-1,2-dihydrophenyl)acetyl-CoA isomerase
VLVKPYQSFPRSECYADLDGQTLIITLNRPDVANAFSQTMIHALCDILDFAHDDPEVRVVVITGAGKSFCAGGDLSFMKDKQDMFEGESAELARRYQRGIQRIPRTLERYEKPVIAMINGAAAGAGLDLACMCDLRVATPKAVFTESFSRLSLVPGDGGTFFLERIVGYPRAMEMFLTARVYNAQEALSMNLVHKVASDDSAQALRALVDEYISVLIKRAPLAITYTKLALKQARRSDHLSQLDLLALMQGIAQRTKDHDEGVEAFLEKRDPKFQGQ